MLIVGLFDPVIHSHCSSRTIPVFTTTPIGDILIVIAANLVISVAVEYKRCSTPLSWNECDSGHYISFGCLLVCAFYSYLNGFV